MLPYVPMHTQNYNFCVAEIKLKIDVSTLHCMIHLASWMVLVVFQPWSYLLQQMMGPKSNLFIGIRRQFLHYVALTTSSQVFCWNLWIYYLVFLTSRLSTRWICQSTMLVLYKKYTYVFNTKKYTHIIPGIYLAICNFLLPVTAVQNSSRCLK